MEVSDNGKYSSLLWYINIYGKMFDSTGTWIHIHKTFLNMLLQKFLK